MNKSIKGNIAETRLLTLEQAQTYIGMGRTMCRKWCEEIGATVRFGRCIRFDKTVIDRALDAMKPETISQ